MRDCCKTEYNEGNGFNSLQYFLPGKFQGQRSLAGYSPWRHERAGHTAQRLNHLPVLHNRSLLSVCFIRSSVYLLIPNFWFIHPGPLVTISLFYALSLFLFCKWAPLSHFFRFHTRDIMSFSVTYLHLLHSVWQSLGLPTVLQMALFPSF